MAQRVEVVLLDDIDGSSADRTVRFEFDGTAYEIDLSEANADKFRDAVAPWLAHARKVSRSGGAARRRTSAPSGNANDIREWAREQGMNVSSRGRVSAEVREAYNRAH